MDAKDALFVGPLCISNTCRSFTEKKTQWDGDLKKLKNDAKDKIEAMAASWSSEEKAACVGATAAAFHGGGAINEYLASGAPAASI